MRTNIVSDDDLMAQALKLGGYRTKRRAVEEGLGLLVRLRRQERARRLRGKLDCQGSLDDLRRDR